MAVAGGQVASGLSVAGGGVASHGVAEGALLEDWNPRRLGSKALAWWDSSSRERHAYGGGPDSRAVGLMGLELAADDFVLGAGTLAEAGSGYVTIVGRCVPDAISGTQGLVGVQETAGGGIAQVYLNSSGRVVVATYTGGLSLQGTAAFTNQVGVAGELLSYVATFARDGSSRTIRARTVTGVTAQTQSDAGEAISAELDVSEVGGFLGTDLNKFAGSKSEVAFFDSELSEADQLRFLGGEDPQALSVKPRSCAPLQTSYADTGTHPVTWTPSGSPSFNTTDPEVSVLRDLSGNGVHLIGWDQGKTHVSIGGGKYGLGGTGALSATVATQSAPLSLHHAFAPDDAGAARYSFVLGADDGSHYWAIYSETSGGVGANVSGAVIGGTGGFDALTGGGTSTDGTWRTTTLAVLAADDQRLRVDGSEVDTGTTSIVPAGATVLILGAALSDGTLPLVGDQGRAAWTTTLTAAEQAALDAWLQAGYAGAA